MNAGCMAPVELVIPQGSFLAPSAPAAARKTSGALGIPCPEVDYKMEGDHGDGWTLTGNADPIAMGADRFMDGRRFDAGQLRAYVEGFDIRHKLSASDSAQEIDTESVAETAV